jgi:hypothetical protein
MHFLYLMRWASPVPVSLGIAFRRTQLMFRLSIIFGDIENTPRRLAHAGLLETMPRLIPMASDICRHRTNVAPLWGPVPCIHETMRLR